MPQLPESLTKHHCLSFASSTHLQHRGNFFNSSALHLQIHTQDAEIVNTTFDIAVDPETAAERLCQHFCPIDFLSCR
jgi:hypothetical protein